MKTDFSVLPHPLQRGETTTHLPSSSCKRFCFLWSKRLYAKLIAHRPQRNICIADTLFQIKLPKNRYPGAVNHGTTPQRNKISLYWLLICLQGKHTEKAGGFFVVVCFDLPSNQKLKIGENNIYKLKWTFIILVVHYLPFGCWLTHLFSAEPPFPHSQSRCPRRLDTNKVNVFHPFGDSDLSQDEQITDQEHQLHLELLWSYQGSRF